MNTTVLDKLLVPSTLPSKSDQQPNKNNPRLVENQGVEPNRSFIKQFYAIFVEPLPNPNRIFQNRKERTATEPNNVGPIQGWKPKPKPKPENPVLKKIFETQTETDTYSAKFLKT